MLVNCRKCQALIDAGRDFCPHCFTSLKRPGIFARVFEWLFDRGLLGDGGDSRTIVFRSDSKPIVHTSVSQRITVVDPQSGEKHEYTRWEDVPQHWRDRIHALRHPGAAHANTGDPSDVVDLLADEPRSRAMQNFSQTYSNFTEMPEELRRLLATLSLADRGTSNVRIDAQSKTATKSHIITQTDSGPKLEESRYSFRGGDGVEHAYNSLDEMPPDVRAMFEAMARETAGEN
jgi:hypothetical protein